MPVGFHAATTLHVGRFGPLGPDHQFADHIAAAAITVAAAAEDAFTADTMSGMSDNADGRSGDSSAQECSRWPLVVLTAVDRDAASLYLPSLIDSLAKAREGGGSAAGSSLHPCVSVSGGSNGGHAGSAAAPAQALGAARTVLGHSQGGGVRMIQQRVTQGSGNSNVGLQSHGGGGLGTWDGAVGSMKEGGGVQATTGSAAGRSLHAVGGSQATADAAGRGLQAVADSQATADAAGRGLDGALVVLTIDREATTACMALHGDHRHRCVQQP